MTPIEPLDCASDRLRPPGCSRPRAGEHDRGVPAGPAPGSNRAGERCVAHRRRGARARPRRRRRPGRLRRRPISSMARADLPAHVPALEDLYAACGGDYELSLDVKDAGRRRSRSSRWPGAAGAVGAPVVVPRPASTQVAAWRALDPDVRLVDSTRLRSIKEGPERRAASLAAAGSTRSTCTPATGRRAHHPLPPVRALRVRLGRPTGTCAAIALLEMGVDAVYSDHVDRMVDVLAEFGR